MSTGTFVVSQPLNYRGGARVEPVDASGTEKAFEPATGNGSRGAAGARVGARLWRELTPPRPRGETYSNCWTFVQCIEQALTERGYSWGRKESDATKRLH